MTHYTTIKTCTRCGNTFALSTDKPHSFVENEAWTKPYCAKCIWVYLREETRKTFRRLLNSDPDSEVDE